MTTTYTFDVFSSVDGFGSASGNWTGGTPLFATLTAAISLERTTVQVTPAATHLGFRVMR